MAYLRHCERSEAIQNLEVKLDCFATLAMTKVSSDKFRVADQVRKCFDSLRPCA
jgi:hypothetical protein